MPFVPARIGERWEDLRVILDSVPAFIWYKDTENRILRVNRPAAESMGLSVAEIEGASTYDLYPEEAAQYHRDDLEVIHADRPKLGIVEPLLTANGEKRWIRTDKVPYHDEAGRVIGIIVFSVDITERVRAEEALREARDLLEVRVAERTMELATALEDLRVEMAERRRAEVQVSQQQAELAHLQRLRTVESMAAEIAHEINQPLGAIANFASGLARRLRAEAPDLEVLSGVATEVAEQAVRAAEVVRRVRHFVRKEGSHRASCDITEVVDAAVQLMEAHAHALGVALHVAVEPGLPSIHVDRIQIVQVLVNLISNALDAIEGVEPPADQRHAILVEAARRDDDRIELRVHDTGIGLGSENAPQMFEPFFTTKADGLGMGLAISRTIVEAHGGTLDAATGRGRGAVFVFTLPVG